MKEFYKNSSPYVIVGDGRVAKHIQHYFSLYDIPYVGWSRKIATEVLYNHALQSDVILLPISDDAIVPFINSHEILKKKVLVHFSGSLVTNLACGMHPLMTFGKKLYPTNFYPGIPFIGESTGPCFKNLFPALLNPFFTIDKKNKAYYHALCVMSGNFTNILWQKIISHFENEFKIPKDALIPYLLKTFENIKDDPFDNLSGPIARGDTKTTTRNLDSLKNDEFHDIYQGFCKINLTELRGETYASK
ncbi:MAG: DUF2520 domain-containing protein [Bacteriovoracaceae bacterium]|nr:DUF2520 domain-containing protein [Bacteriovoracaceae bacterium]